MPFLEIEKSEAEKLSEAARDVFALYEMEVSPELAAWLRLAAVSGAIYGPKAALFWAMKKQAQEDAQRQADDNARGATSDANAYIGAAGVE